MLFQDGTDTLFQVGTKLAFIFYSLVKRGLADYRCTELLHFNIFVQFYVPPLNDRLWSKNTNARNPRGISIQFRISPRKEEILPKPPTFPHSYFLPTILYFIRWFLLFNSSNRNFIFFEFFSVSFSSTKILHIFERK